MSLENLAHPYLTPTTEIGIDKPWTINSLVACHCTVIFDFRPYGVNFETMGHILLDIFRERRHMFHHVEHA